MKFSGEKVVEIYEKIQQKRPIIHCITNAAVPAVISSLRLRGERVDDGAG